MHRFQIFHSTKGAFHLLELSGPKELILTGLNVKAEASLRNYPRDPCVIYTQDLM